ncbi:NAD(P)H-dependent oxidoreductase subunit E [Sphingobium boeckii]|uniref:Formate dehydrogenase subunit gamma n=1 Tax=Sphingobium boeckii TaxID=1082345 RepID=A0A7W9ALC0_9SPHN|nr:NAD(P)H-dependent oxidoreductase subunit E [Sphingobium boeckii]MBB5687795.1 formate dehydrogenase subunit gamma [Sphingobium boeckii]
MERQGDNEFDAERVTTTIRQNKHLEGALLPILHALQAEFGWIDDTTIRAVALELNLSRAEVHGVISFYHDFRTRPEARPVIKLCRAEACQARGSEPLANWAAAKAANRIAIEPVYCLGLCSVGPNAMIGHDVYARLDEASLGALIEAL